MTAEHRQYLQDDLRAIKVERAFAGSLETIACYWEIGQRLAQDEAFQKATEERGAISYLGGLAKDLGWSKMTLHRGWLFFRKFPDLELDQGYDKLLDAFPKEGKAISWRKIVHNYLPEAPRDEREGKRSKAKKAAEYSEGQIGQPWTATTHDELCRALGL